MPPQAVDESYARLLLEQHGLPVDIEIVVPPPPEMNGGYNPSCRRMALRSEVHDLTILHEGAHAEHYRRLGVENQPWPTSTAGRLGWLLSSEAYVGLRLATVPGFIDRERVEIAKFFGQSADTVGQWARLYGTPRQVQGSKFDGSLMSTSGFLAVLKLTPLVVAESVTDDVHVSVDLGQRVPTVGDRLLECLRLSVRAARIDAALVSLPAVEQLGVDALECLRSIGPPFHRWT